MSIDGVLASVAARTLRWDQGEYYWGDAIAYDGLLAAADRLGDQRYAEELAARLKQWAAGAPDSWDDALAPGAAAASLYRQGSVPQTVLHRVKRAVQRLPVTQDGIPLLRPHVHQWRTLVWVDSLYHLPSTFLAVGEALEDEHLRERGLGVATAILNVLKCDGAVVHAFDTGLGTGPRVRWTRGIGWALLGLLDVCRAAPEQAAEAGFPAEAQGLLRALVAEQREDGHFPTVLGQEVAAAETSVAAFVVAAALHPALPDTVGIDDHGRRAAVAVMQAVADDGTYMGVSYDTHVRESTQEYLDPPRMASPWGQGAALRALVAMHDAGAQIETDMLR